MKLQQTKNGLFEKELKKTPWYIYTYFKFWWIDFKHKISK